MSQPSPALSPGIAAPSAVMVHKQVKETVFVIEQIRGRRVSPQRHSTGLTIPNKQQSHCYT